MQFGSTRRQKPGIGAQIDRSHPMVRGLSWFAPLWESSGTSAVDLINGNDLAINSGTTWTPGGSPVTGGGLAVTANSLGGVSGAWPASLQSNGPYSLVCAFRWTGSAHSSYADIFGLCANGLGTGGGTLPIMIQWSATGSQLRAYIGGNTIVGSASLIAGTDYVVALAYNGSGAAGSSTLWLNGAVIGTGLGYSAAPYWGAGAAVFVGGQPGTAAGNPAVKFYWGGIYYNRALLSPTVAAWTQNPWQIFRPAIDSALFGGSPGTFTASPSLVSSNSSLHQTIVLTGTGTSWMTGSTIFSPSGVSGVTKISQNITSTTAATLVITTGSGTGTLTISDGSTTATTQVVTPTFTISPSSGTYSVPTLITATGSAGSRWTQAVAATLFATPGTFGDSISSITVNSDTSATFMLNPGTATGNLAVTMTVGATTASYAIAGTAGSLRIFNEWAAATTGNMSLLVNKSLLSFSFFVKYNTGPGTYSGNLISSTYQPYVRLSNATAIYQLWSYSGASPVGFTHHYVQGVAYHVAMTWNAASQWHIYINGIVVASGSTGGVNTSGTAQQFLVGPLTSAGIDVQLANLGIWAGYELTPQDALNLCNGVYVPGSLVGSVSAVAQPSTSWWLLGDATSGTPAITDASFTDIGGGGNTLTKLTAAGASASYAGPLAYTPPVVLNSCVTRSGQLAMFVLTAAASSSTLIAGTVSVQRNSTSMTTSLPQVGWINSGLTISGDSSATTYTIAGGHGTTWTISPAYAGSANAVGAAATLIQAATPAMLTSVLAAPTIGVKFGGSGPVETVQTWGPVWSPVSQSLPFVAWLLQCGPVQSVVVQVPGSGYSASPSASASGGGGSGLILGTPLVTGGVTSFSIGNNGGAGYTSAPTVTIAAPSLSITANLTSGSTACTGISTTAGLVPGMVVFGTGNPNNTVATIVSATAITLTEPALVTGSIALTIVGKQAMATATINASTGKVTAINVFVPGSGYATGSPPAVTLTGGGFTSAATVTATVSNVIAKVPVTNPGSGYTSAPTITITDSLGSGAVAVPIMAGVQPSDVVTFSIADNSIATTAGYAGAASSASVANYSGQLEPAVGGLYNFGLPSPARTLQLGMNIAEPTALYSPHSECINWLKRVIPAYSANGSSNISTTTPDGRPILITGTASHPSVATICNQTEPNYIDTTCAPIPVANGVNGNRWTFIADETDPASPMNISMTATGTTITGGAVAGSGVAATGVTSITLGAMGTGYIDVPTVTIEGGGGSGATAYALINSMGQVYWINLLSVGSGYTSPPTVTITGGGGSGATATATIGNVLVGCAWQFVVAQNTVLSPILDLTFWKTVGGTYNYTLVNECLFGPCDTAAAYPSLPIRPSAPGADATTFRWLTTPTPKYPAVIRFMASELIYTNSNVVDAADLKNSNHYSWNTFSSSYTTLNPTGPRTLTITTIRTYALSSAGYPSGWNVTWSSPNVYLSNPGTGGSTAVVPDPLWRGYGSGSPSGGPYYVAPSSIAWLNTNSAPTFVAEFVTSAPHNLKSGQYVSFTGTFPFTVSNGVSSTVSLNTVLGGSNLVFVTGPYTFVISYYTTNISGNAAGLPGNTNNVAGTFPVTLTASVTVPDYQSMPHEAAATVASTFPGCDLWTNIPWGATDLCVQAIANRTLNAFPPGRKVYVEYANEPWNTTALAAFYLTRMDNLGVWNTTAGIGLMRAYTVRASQVHAIFEAVFAAAGRGSEIVRVFGSQDANSGITGTIISQAGTTIEVDAVAVAPYQNSPTDVTTPTVAATVVVGSATTGSLPGGSYYCFYTWVDSLTGAETNVGASQSASFTVSSGNTPVVTLPALPTWGNVTANLYLTAAGGAPGTETLYASGITTTTYTLTSSSWTNGTTTQAAAAVPPAYNLQPSTTLAAAALATHWPTSIAYGSAHPWPRSAYMDFARYAMKYGSTNANEIATQNILNQYQGSTIPQLVCYEGDLQRLVPTGVETGADPMGYYLRPALSADLYYDPNIHDWELAFYEFCQQSGMAVIMPFMLCGPLGGAGGDLAGTSLWAHTTWESQPVGKGDGSTASNGAAVTNQFWTDIQRAPHATNASVRLQAWNDWADSANAFVIPAGVSVTPANGSTGLSSRTIAAVQFDEPMLASTITSNTFTLTSGSNAVTGTVSYNAQTWTATFTPASALTAPTLFQAQVTTGVKNAQGVALAAPITWAFTTESSATLAKRWFGGLRRPTAGLTA